MIASRFALHLVFALILCILASCKPAATPKVTPEQTLGGPSPQMHGDARRQPSMAELSNFVRSTLPPVIKLVEMKNDPPMPMPNTSPGSNVWLVNVRLTFALNDDELGAASPQDAQVLQSAVDELSVLAAWSRAYAESPYASLYPGLTVNPPASASPKLLKVIHPKDRPLAPIYGKMAAEWQVDHWQFSVVDLSLPADDGQFRASFTGPVFIQGEPDTERFLATTKAAIAEAKPKKAAIEAAYEGDLAKATRPGTLYRGQVSRGGSIIAAEVHFLEPPTSDHQTARFEVRMPSAPSYEFTYTAKLAKEMPIHPAPVMGDDGPIPVPNGAEPPPKADLTVGLEHAGGKQDASNTVPNQMLISMKQYMQPSALPLSLLNGRIEGEMCDSSDKYRLSAQRVP